MFFNVYLTVWSVISLLMGVTVYTELQKHGDSLYHVKDPLLTRFPLHTTLCCDTGCNSPVSHGYTLDSYSSRGGEFLTYSSHTKINIFSKTLFNMYNVTLWRGEISGSRGFVHPSAVEEVSFNCILKQQSFSPRKQTVSMDGRSSDSRSGNDFTTMDIYHCFSSVKAILHNMCLENDQQGLAHVDLNNSSPQIQHTCIKNDRQGSCLNNSSPHHQELPLGKFQAPPKAINYSVDIANQNRIEWKTLFVFALWGVSTIIYVCVHFLDLIWNGIKNNLVQVKMATDNTDRSKKEVLILIETLLFFKHHFELVVQQKNAHFNRAQQYHKENLTVNMEKDLLSAEIKALKKEITCFKAKLTNQRFYIELLEKVNEKALDTILDYNKLAEKQQLEHTDCMDSAKGNQIDSDEETPNSSDESQTTFVGVYSKDYHSLNEKLLQQQRLQEFIQTSHSLKSIFIHSPDENDHEVRQQQILLQTSHSFFIHSPNKDDQEMLKQQSFIQKSHSVESVFIHSPNKDGQEVLQDIRGSEEYLQRSEQISHNVSDIIDHKKRLNQMYFNGRPPLSFLLQLPTPKLHWLPPSHFCNIVVLLSKDGVVTPSKSYPEDQDPPLTHTSTSLQ